MNVQSMESFADPTTGLLPAPEVRKSLHPTLFAGVAVGDVIPAWLGPGVLSFLFLASVVYVSLGGEFVAW